MNLLMVSGDASVAQGREGAFFQMLRRFSRYWERIDILCPFALGATSRTVHGNVHVHPSGWHKALQPLFIVQQGRALLAQRDYALITSHDFGLFYNGFGVWWLTRGTEIPYVSEIHHVEGYPRAVTLRERFYRAIAMRYLPWVAQRAAAIRVVNRVEMPELLRRLGVPEDKILVLPSLYIDFEIFRPMPEPRCYDVLFVGRLASNKGLFTIVEAVGRLKAKYPNIQLGILGQGPLKTALEAQIAALGLEANVAMISRLNNAEEVARLYNQAAMLVCASSAEGGPRVTVEAMACGVPVISTPVGMMRELLHDGVNGLVFHWDAAELADKISLLLESETLRRQLGEEGRAAVQPFEAEREIEQYAHGYHDLIRQAGKR